MQTTSLVHWDNKIYFKFLFLEGQYIFRFEAIKTNDSDASLFMNNFYLHNNTIIRDGVFLWMYQISGINDRQIAYFDKRFESINNFCETQISNFNIISDFKFLSRKNFLPDLFL